MAFMQKRLGSSDYTSLTFDGKCPACGEQLPLDYTCKCGIWHLDQKLTFILTVVGKPKPRKIEDPEGSIQA